ncbi:MAG: tRNA-dihydrouridine synthase family protein [Desulfobacteraceae bacterium]|nr:tRNA-dihydrouridine synthase family protein [Desulfobacteraceae bacterium]
MKQNKTELILAPLDGFTDVIFRNIYSKYFSGVDEAIAPFISTLKNQVIHPVKIRDILPELNKSLPVTPQILSNSPEDFLFLAMHFFDMGYTSVNWNLGCPQLQVVRKKKGAGLIPFVEEIDAFLDIVFDKMPMDLSIKVRLGKKHPDEIFSLLKVFDKYPVEEIILHPRTGTQFYKGDADVDAFASVLKETNHKMVYNGDIRNKKFFLNIQKKFPAINRFMIGRGVLENPFLPSIIKNQRKVSQKESLKILYNFIDDLFNAYKEIKRDEKLIGKMKGFWTYFIKSFHKDEKAFKKILLSKTEKQYEDEVSNFFLGAKIL